LQISGTALFATASSISATVKFNVPGQTEPVRFGEPAQRFFQRHLRIGPVQQKQITSVIRKHKTFLGRAQQVIGAKCVVQTLVVTNTSGRLMPDARTPSPTSRSFSYICAVSIWR
jgi:hypothetical protein